MKPRFIRCRKCGESCPPGGLHKAGLFGYECNNRDHCEKLQRDKAVVMSWRKKVKEEEVE